ncbi:type I-E CRISPR-associated protein Cse2/CasB [Methylomonas albis]|uniref:Type I-E CRISPR-associated protein Cse2/CasB n=1 Tax=Methylomonas albis TaxID=1854563 RepID=A0ABR9D3Y6_9GAMM|nr:type I-E CRISPR-associated protein Cse2/CasB [Methylomonas albis]MBD9357839.1 type I-E CRISPR-associated protein Cse2/CasB [Methylomonas albis]
MSQPSEKVGKSAAFVNYTIERCQQDNGLAAALRRADNPNTEYQSWEHLAAFVDLDQAWRRLPYATVAAAIARAKAEHNGSLGIGRAIAACYDDDNQSDQAKAKLRRLLACEQVEEACRILRPLFGLIEAKAGIPLNYAGLLDDLLYFNFDPQRVKARWAQDFFRRGEQGATDEQR